MRHALINDANGRTNEIAILAIVGLLNEYLVYKRGASRSARLNVPMSNVQSGPWRTIGVRLDLSIAAQRAGDWAIIRL
jgi:hypothetical protein